MLQCFKYWYIMKGETEESKVGGEKMITTLLWDIDGTLLNFSAAEKAAIRSLFQEYGRMAITEDL